MSRQSAKQMALKAHWYRWRRAVMVVLVLASVMTAIFVSLGVGALLFMVTLGLATFSGGGPAGNGPSSPPSVPGTHYGA